MAGSYSQDNIAAMQEDALKRVRDMQKKAQQRVKQNQSFDIYDDQLFVIWRVLWILMKEKSATCIMRL